MKLVPDPSFPYYTVRINIWAVVWCVFFPSVAFLIFWNHVTNVERQLREQVVIAQTETHTLKQEAVQLDVAYWQGVDENVSFFKWKDASGKLPEYRRPKPRQ
jgi:hypothetical protein